MAIRITAIVERIVMVKLIPIKVFSKKLLLTILTRNKFTKVNKIDIAGGNRIKAFGASWFIDWGLPKNNGISGGRFLIMINIANIVAVFTKIASNKPLRSFICLLSAGARVLLHQ